MADLPILDAKGKSQRTLAADDAVFAAPIKSHVVRLAVNAQLANRRAGTQSTKTRGFVSGGGKKPFKQKGTGRARQGTSRAPQMRHGAIIFGPSPRSWRQRLNVKVRRQAITSALSSLAQAGQIKVVESFGLTEPKTKQMAAVLANLGLAGAKTLLLLTDADRTVRLAARNIPGVTVGSTEELSVVDLVSHDAVVATPGAIKRIEALLAASAEAA
ncbi:MAG: 50S ribosomal protein L4 [Candidatus Sumerlaeia bacterium]|nr:50S ribosomal protein L4 [Candidatus Sumerlaeia bacterium]